MVTEFIMKPHVMGFAMPRRVDDKLPCVSTVRGANSYFRLWASMKLVMQPKEEC